MFKYLWIAIAIIPFIVWSCHSIQEIYLEFKMRKGRRFFDRIANTFRTLSPSTYYWIGVVLGGVVVLWMISIIEFVDYYLPSE